MVGPSVCIMCQKVEETTLHLLQGCDWSTKVWAKGGTLFEKPQLGESPIQDTIENWSEKAFKNVILNRIWECFLEFVVWETWKDRNSCIFEGRKW